jgi:hypothetical protein
MTLRRRCVCGVLGGLAAVVTAAGCSASGPECAATEPVAAAELPPVLRSAGGDWYGTDDLWVAVPDWPAVFRFPASGCWAEHGTLGETQVRLVLDVEAAADPGAG